VEFSNAGFPEGQKLQRCDGLVASAENNCLYVKISPLKKVSLRQHGGNIEFDYVKPYALIFHKFGQLFFHFDWKVDKNGLVEVDKNYLSCPNRIVDFEKLIQIVLTNAIQSKDFWKNIKKEILNYGPFSTWYKTLANYKIKENVELNTSRTRWVTDKKILELKINRFGHAMDPERGMLAFYGTLTRVVPKMLFDQRNDAWYKDIPKESEIRNYIKKNRLIKGYDFLYCFMLGSGLYNNKDFIQIVYKHRNDKSSNIGVDITDFVKKNFSEINKSIRTILKYSNMFIIVDEKQTPRVILRWKDAHSTKEFGKNPEITLIQKISSLDEDVVTYITINNILKLNGFKILAASYPGAQADRVILIEPGTGRRQKRKYVDIIAYLEKKNITSLQENKGPFSISAIQEDINELSNYKTNKKYKEALKYFQDRFEPKSVNSIIKIGVGFWSNPNFKISKIKDLDLKELDYFVYITPNMKNWKIWRTGIKNMFSKTSGDVKIPLIYEVIENKSKGIKTLSNFY
ncbi:MAG: hypothetical protein N3F05_04585, partial [Candidatus Diapherotrites archaeon]|nr:hypothetical protein [Candidatus Diapherotrites archaeon]